MYPSFRIGIRVTPYWLAFFVFSWTCCHAADSADVIAVVAVDALADLDPLPVRVHTGDWLDLSAHLEVEARGATVMIAPPDGAPLRVPTSFDGSARRTGAAHHWHSAARSLTCRQLGRS